MVKVTNVSRTTKRRAQLTGSGSEGPTPRAGKSEYSEGALVSLRMVNFLSYEDAFVQFGPRLNVVMGPNGTGKSTLVCAMALVLAGSPKVTRVCSDFGKGLAYALQRKLVVRVHVCSSCLDKIFKLAPNLASWNPFIALTKVV